jgi:UDP-glucose 4-epimerase
VILRYFNTYGPYQIAQFVIPKFLSCIQKGDPPIIYGDGSQKRSYCYVSDTAWATVEALLSKRADGEVINIGNSKSPVSLSDLADLLIKMFGKEGQIRPKYEEQFKNADRVKEREIFERFCDTSKAERILNYSPQVPLEKGIANVIKEGVLFPKWASTDLYYTLDESL